jgi:uncharacterized protein (TIGR03437 family)
MRFALLLLIPVFLTAQLIPVGQPVPKTANPPVVFLNGYQSGCTADSSFSSNFGSADKLLQSAGLVTLYFDNCTVTGSPTIEAVGIAFGKFLAALKYTDGTPVTQVDVVAHSMGGLIVRCYLSGKQDTALAPATFIPPATIPIRRAILLGTPHFGTALANLLGSDKQSLAQSLGSQFLFDLATWNQGTDDLRGIAAIAVSGSGGTGTESGIKGFDDGLMTLTSSALTFARPGFTRIVPYCHTANSLLLLIGYCTSGTPTLNILTTDPNNLVGQILISYLTGTEAWKTIGESGDTNAVLSGRAGLSLQLRDKTDLPLALIGGSVTNATPALNLKANAGGLLYAEALTANTSLDLQLTPLSGTAQTTSLKLAGGTTSPTIVKPGPVISPRGVIPAAGPAPFPYDVAPGAYVSVYGANLASATQGASIPYPTQIADVQVLVNGVAAPMVFVSTGQINFVYPNVAPGLTQLTVKTMDGQHTVNVRVAPAVPSIFLLDAAGTAAARNALTGTVVGPNSPLRADDFLSLYVTGLGATNAVNNLDYALTLPVLTIGGQNVPLTYAGRTPGFAGLDQINCKIPAGLKGDAVPVVVTSGGRSSATAYLAIQ